MRDWLAERAYATPNSLALVMGSLSWTYAELDRHVETVASGLAAQGVGAGLHVAALMNNSPRYVCLVHALARLGAVLVPLNTRLAASELFRQLGHADASILVHDGHAAETALALRSQRWSVVDEMALRTDPEARRMSSPSFDLNAPQAIIYTSGTTGDSKGVILTFANHLWSATASSYRIGIQPGDRWLSCLPLYHVGGLAVILRSCLYGTAVVLHERFDVDAFNRSLKQDGVTLASMVPTMLFRMLAGRTESWPETFRLLLLGGAAVSSSLIEEAHRCAIPLALTYGLTEASSQVATMRPEGVLRKPGSVGKPLMFTSARIAGEDGGTLPPGETGEVVVRGPTVMAGYYRDPAATKQAIRNGELRTGDVGYVDSEGDLWLVERRVDIIVSGGENVYPSEVEAVLEQHPAIARACVVGVPDAEWGQRVAALVELQVPGPVTTEELVDFSRQHLAGYKLPRLIEIVDSLPLTASGKIQRRAAADRLARFSDTGTRGMTDG